MEIGVADGDNARNMVEVAAEKFSPGEVYYYGFDTFGLRGSNERKDVSRKLAETGCNFELFEGDTKGTLLEVFENLPKMDLIFVDGGHDFDTVKSDWRQVRKLMKRETGVFFPQFRIFRTKKSRREYFERELFGQDYGSALRLQDGFCKNLPLIISGLSNVVPLAWITFTGDCPKLLLIWF